MKPNSISVEQELGGLHALLVTEFTKRLKDPDCPTQLFKEAREFLKDNKITADFIKSPEGQEFLGEILTDDEIREIQDGGFAVVK